jgi:hypothetical protein
VSGPLVLSPNDFTFGFEIETWADINRYSAFLRRLGFSEIYVDGSGPWETYSPPMRMFRDVAPALLYPSLLIDYRKRWVIERRDGGTASTHHHIAHRAWSDHLAGAEELFSYLSNHINLMAPFFSRRARKEGDRLVPGFTRERRRWADSPGCFEPSSRYYWSVTPNPSSAHKPFTLEIRLCETAPIVCSAALHALVAGFIGGVYMSHYGSYETPVPVRAIESYVSKVDSRVPLPDWVHKVFQATIENGRRPVTIVGLLKNDVIEMRHVQELIEALRLTGPEELPRAGMLGKELLDYLKENGL